MKGKSEQMGPLLSTAEPSPSLEEQQGASPTSPESRDLQKLLILKLMFTSPTYLSEGGVLFDHTILPPLPQGEIRS